ncbi:MAG: S8 family serine peptidase [Bacteroidota bacterium]
MKSLFIGFLVFFVTFALSQEQPHKYWIYFKAKEPLALSKASSPSDIARLTGISERAQLRRSKVLQQNISSEDLPVSDSYLLELKAKGITVENTSRWFNAATAYLSQAQYEQVQSLSFVQSVERVSTFKRKELPKSESFIPQLSKQAAGKFVYGLSQSHMTAINAIAVHNIGISGRGVLVGMLDTGFRWKIHEAMQNMKVIAEYDFIQKDTNTANEGTDGLSQDSHGTSTMSLVGAYKDGQLVSPAFNANFILGKTEYVPSETNVEEDNWVAAIEWMEARGVDVVSSSLGYKEFDAGQKSYVYTDMNGKTATTSKAATIAARKGVVVVNAMGNEGANLNPPSLTTPADADSIISVGAVSGSGILAGFSSNGPTSDGRMKPDVMAHGIGTYAATASKTGYTGSSQGTSLATPLVAGVSAMILSAHPELTPIQVRDALRTTASNADKPNNSIGWGIINAYKAVLNNGMVISTDPEISLTQDSNYSIGVFVVSKSVVKKDSIRILYTVDNGLTFTTIPMTLGEIVDTATNSGKYSAVVPKLLTTPRFYVRAVDATNVSRTSPYTAPTDLYDAKTGTTGVTPVDPVPVTFSLQQNYPNPFNPATTIGYDLPKSGYVSLVVYDLLGREVATLVNEVKSYGKYAVPFNGSAFASGVYFYRLRSENFVETKRMMLIK